MRKNIYFLTILLLLFLGKTLYSIPKWLKEVNIDSNDNNIHEKANSIVLYHEQNVKINNSESVLINDLQLNWRFEFVNRLKA
ncbi:MAG: hypothetical protein K8S23_12255, partial [Candidatus Cloacimonetes bacterium]|nr:hypothetical protein [Candidatus Cloacimonadota bacterium]